MMETKSDSEKIKKNLVFLKSSTLTLWKYCLLRTGKKFQTIDKSGGMG